MRLGLWALLALVLGAFAAHFLLQDRGYVLVNFRGYVVEMSVPGLVLVLVFGYLLVRGLVALAHAPRRLGTALTERRSRRGSATLMQALVHITEGEWARGERLLTRGLKTTDAPLANYLLAARAAQLQGATQRRDEWLKLAHDESPGNELAVLLTRAELELTNGELDAAAATLARIERLKPDHPVAIGLRARLYDARGERESLGALLPHLARARLDHDVRSALIAKAFEAAAARKSLTQEELGALWSELPTDLRTTPALVALKAQALQRLGRGDEAEKELRTALKRGWERVLVEAYGEARSNDPAKQLRQAETWLGKHPEDGALLLAAARLSMANELWGKARSYLESSLALAPEPGAYALYGQLLTQLGEGEGASLAFRSGLALVSPLDAKLPDLTRASLEPPRGDKGSKKGSKAG
jgi:HemY protein